MRIEDPNNHSDVLKRGPCLAWMGDKQLRSPGAGLLRYQVVLGANLGSQREGDLWPGSGQTGAPCEHRSVPKSTTTHSWAQSSLPTTNLNHKAEANISNATSILGIWTNANIVNITHCAENMNIKILRYTQQECVVDVWPWWQVQCDDMFALITKWHEWSRGVKILAAPFPLLLNSKETG